MAPEIQAHTEQKTLAGAADRLKVLDLFSGIGGFSLGLERTGGFETVAFCEIDPYCRRVLAKHWPEVPCHGDIREFRGADVGPVDAIVGGFPCQDVSIAGNRSGLDGERSGLWVEMGRLVREIRPRFVVVENTAGLLDLGLLTVLGDLAAIGYDAAWHAIPASAVGAAHERDRAWVVAYDRAQRWGERADSDGEHAGQVLQDINRQLAISLCGTRVLEPDADPLACFGARIPDGREARTAYLESALCRKVHGIPLELDAVGALGNAVVPHIPELIGRAILESSPHSRGRR